MTAERSPIPPFHLIRYVSLTTLGTLVVGGIVAGAVLTQLTREELSRRTEGRAVAAAHHLIFELYHQLLLPQLAAEAQPSIDTMGTWDSINRLVAPLQHFQSLYAVKIFDPTGAAVYSSNPSESADMSPGNPGFLAALEGRTTTGTSGTPGNPDRTGTPVDGSIVTTFVPIFAITPGLRSMPESGLVIGVMEVYQDISALLIEHRQQLRVILALVAGTVAGLYLLLLGILYRANRRMAADFAEIERSHADLLEQRNRLDTILAHLKEGVALYDEERRIVFMNRPMVERFGDQNGQRCYEALYGLERPCCLTPEEKVDEHLCQQTWFSMVTPTNDYFEIFTTPVVRPDGKRWTLELLRDIGDRVAMERQRSQMRQELAAERERTVSELLVGLNHEINNSIAGIITTLSLLDDPNLGGKERQDARARIKREVERIERVITSLPTAGQLDTVEYVGGVTMVDPWVLRTDLSVTADDHCRPS